MVFSSLTYPSLNQEENKLGKKVKSRRKSSSFTSSISSTSSNSRTKKFDKDGKLGLDNINLRPKNIHADNSEIIERKSNVSLNLDPCDISIEVNLSSD